MPVLDVRLLSDEVLSDLAIAYDKLSKQELAPICQLDIDPVRQRMDDAILKALGLPAINSIRELLAREPGLTAHDIAPQQNPAADDEEGDESQQGLPNLP